MTKKTIKVQFSAPLGLIGFLLVVAKLAGLIGWSWWLVTLPFWIFYAFAVGIIAICFVVALLGVILTKLSK